ncbi:hypothetical protein [Cellulomonas denverensis]|uniref:Uncharacterized protein n=1 Tax=Cellulomonas denverensis TaxID=264297 RepID=A0A7X6KWU2_9CELL|nr:hypothetical protein [Cellulomonas denverensis]NKY23717.1 hypothetical protein [Cellulomonas denverensis]GIG25794.1 hypothetical protein Cde04nite_20380 [Cellulomonas denverensis]
MLVNRLLAVTLSLAAVALGISACDAADEAAAAGDDPAAAAALMDQMTTTDTWTATINESLFTCA